MSGSGAADWYDDGFYSNPLATERNPENQSVGEKKYRVLRGGSWGDETRIFFRSALRGSYVNPLAGASASGSGVCQDCK